MTIYKLYGGLCYVHVDTHRFAFQKASIEMTVESKEKKSDSSPNENQTHETRKNNGTAETEGK